MKYSIKETVAKRDFVKLSVKDKKLIQLLIQNSRMPVTQLSKKVGISQPAIVQKISALKKKRVLINPVLYSSVKLQEKPLYVVEISTQIGVDTKKLNDELLKIQEIIALIWYNGNYNLILLFNTHNPQEVVDSIIPFIEIKKLRIREIIDGWFHPPYLFKEVSDKNVEFKKTIQKIDQTDRRILKCLEENPNATYVELSTKTRLVPQTIKKRINKMEKEKTILLYTYIIDPWLCSKEVMSVSLICKGRKETDNLIKHLLKIPQVSNIWEHNHEWNLNFVMWVDEQFEASKIINQLTKNFDIIDTDVSAMVSISGK